MSRQTLGNYLGLYYISLRKAELRSQSVISVSSVLNKSLILIVIVFIFDAILYNTDYPCDSVEFKSISFNTFLSMLIK